MARILDRLPVPTEDTMAFAGEAMVPVRAYEIPIWVSLAPRDVMDPSRLPRLPALLDTAHTHNFAIQEEHLTRWAGLPLDSLGLGRGNVRRETVSLPLRSVHLWVHSNEPGHWDRVANRPPHRIHVPEGIVVYPAGSDFPRLPLLGLRAILRNKLHLAVNGRNGRVSLKTGSWWWPFG